MPSRTRTTFIVTLLSLAFIACSDDPGLDTAPALTEEDVARIVAEEIAKIDIDAAVQRALAEADTGLTLQELAEIALNSTVVVEIKDKQNRTYEGSGFVVEGGRVVTAAHVMEGFVSGSVWRVGHKKKYPIESILATDKGTDIAILQSPIPAPALQLGDSDTVQIGDFVCTAGNPKSHEGTFTTGIVSAIRPDGVYLALDKEQQEGLVFQITSPAAGGSSGGPVLNAEGDVIAILVAIFVGAQNLNYAVAVNELKPLLSSIQ